MLIKFQLKFNKNDDELRSSFDPKCDSIYLSGSSRFLGEWDLNRAIEMKMLGTVKTTGFNDTGSISSECSMSSSISPASSSSELYLDEKKNPIINFETSVYIRDEEYEDVWEELNSLGYKYFVAQRTNDITQGERFFLKQVEYNWRTLSKRGLDSKMQSTNNINIMKTNDQWPLYDDEDKKKRIDHGWLLNNENEFQFHFYASPCQLWLSSKPVSIEIIPWTTLSGLNQLKDFYSTQMDFTENEISDLNKMKGDKTEKNPLNAFNNPDVYSSYRIRTFEKPSTLLFQFNIREFEADGSLNSTCLTTGYFRVPDNLCEQSQIETDIALLSNNQMCGSLKAEVVLITSLNVEANNLVTKNFNYHFNRRKECIPIGHRGMGKTFDATELPKTGFTENTLDSFREAMSRGAEMVEFDIVLTKDKIPIIYHDFVFCIDQVKHLDPAPNQSQSVNSKYLSVGVNQMTYEEIKQNKIYSHKILTKLRAQSSSSSTDDSINDDMMMSSLEHDPNTFTSKKMFPTLREMCTELSPKLGFNIEIKFPLDLEDGTAEIDQHLKWLSRSQYIDVILKELFECTKGTDRCIIISTFDPNLCSMIRMKQNTFPVLFLTNGITNKKRYKDFRTKSTQMSLNYIKSENLHGIVAHSEELSRNLKAQNIIYSHSTKSGNFYAYSWGDYLNEQSRRRAISELGIRGIIYDRMDGST